MRMHAQTAMIENGFVHLPKEAAWLGEYLHELTVFPKGKHADQLPRTLRSGATAQMIDWFKQGGSDPTSNAGIWHRYKQQYEAQQSGLQIARPEPLSVMAKRLGRLRPLRRRSSKDSSGRENRCSLLTFDPFADSRSTKSSGERVSAIDRQ